MDERYYIQDLEQRILRAIKKAINTAEICSLLNQGTDLEFGQVSRTDLECELAGIIEMAEITRLIDLYREWFPETPAGEEFEQRRQAVGAHQKKLQMQLLNYIDWLKSRITIEEPDSEPARRSESFPPRGAA